MSKTVYLYAGPSLFDSGLSQSDTSDIVWLPPARRGDIESLLASEKTPGVIALADGTFHAYPSVRHIELRLAIEAGWLVYGLCSMGAIRACEMAHLGMRPWGRVAQGFVDNPGTPDDEVALVHGAEAPYLPISEPLVHIREFLAQMVVQGLLAACRAESVAHSLRERWYGERTLAQLRSELDRVGEPSDRPALTSQLQNFSRFRLKQIDLAAFVEAKPWLSDESNAAATS